MQKEMSGIKSIFVPTNLLREELPIGYDQVAGADGEAETEGVDPDASVAPLFAPADAEPVTTTDAEPETADAEPEPETADAEPEPEPETADAEPETADAAPVQPTEFSADPQEQSGGLVAAIESDMLEPLPNLDDQDGGFDFDDPDQAQVGGFDGAEILNAVQSMFVSASDATLADLVEDGVYQLSIIKGFLDSISRSLAAIADKYAGTKPLPAPTPESEPDQDRTPEHDTGYASDTE